MIAAAGSIRGIAGRGDGEHAIFDRQTAVNGQIRLMAKDTSKAIVIIVCALGVLAGLLTWANHIRPH